MIEKDAKTGEKSADGKARESKHLIETALAQTFEKTPPTDEFRETLLKSGLDVADFSAAEPFAATVSDVENTDVGAVHSTKARNEFLEAGLIQNPSEASEKNKKASPLFGRWRHLTAAAGILAIIVLQSAFQFFFIQDENLRAAENVVNEDLAVEKSPEKTVSETKVSAPKTEEKAKGETEDKKPTAVISTEPKKAATSFQRATRTNIPRPALRKKKRANRTPNDCGASRKF